MECYQCYRLDELPLPGHMKELLEFLPGAHGVGSPPEMSGDLRAFVHNGIERAVWDNGCYLESLRWVPSEGKWVEEYPADLPPQPGEAVMDWNDEMEALYKRACESIQGK